MTDPAARPPTTPPWWRSPEVTARLRSPWLRTLGTVIGVVLLVLAIRAVLRNPQDLQNAWNALRNAHPVALIAIAVLPLCNLVCISGVFHTLTVESLAHSRTLPREDGTHPPRGTFLQTTTGMGAAWLLNFTPVRAGLFGRILYHRLLHGIPVAHSVRATFEALAVGLVAVLLLAGVAFVAHGRSDAVAAGLLIAPCIAATALSVLLSAKAQTHAIFLARALAWRYADVLIWFVRYAVITSALGLRASPVELAAMTAVAQASFVVPFVGNGLGVREWGIATLAPLMTGLAASTNGDLKSPLLTADLINRVADLPLLVPVALICVFQATRQMRAAGGATVGKTA